MKINREYFENAIEPDWSLNPGEKSFTLVEITKDISAYVGNYAHGEVWFETETLEKIGYLGESDVRASRNRYYNATFQFGWDGQWKTRKDKRKTLCTRATYQIARAMLIEEYNKSKNN